MIEVEQVDEDEFALLELAIAEAEQIRSSKFITHPCTAHLQVEFHQSKPSSLTNKLCEEAGGAHNTGKRKLPKSFFSTPSRSAQSEPPLLQYNGKIRYAFTGVEVEEASKCILDLGIPECGFDVEWTVTYQAGVPPRPVALVQLCFFKPPECTCLLLHVSRSGVTPSLRQVLASKDIVKVGVGAHGDALKVLRDYGFEMGGVCDLSEYANMRLCRDDLPPPKWSLAGLTEQLLGCTLDKSQRLRCSDWEAFPLSAEQLTYAAADVFASLRLFQALRDATNLVELQWLPTCAGPPGDAGGVAASAAPLAAPPLAAPTPPGGSMHPAMPACCQVAPLQPAKLAVYQQHAQQGVPLPQVAAARSIQEDTAQGYFAEAILAGYAYRWGACGVPDTTLRRVAASAGELLGVTLACVAAPVPLPLSGPEPGAVQLDAAGAGGAVAQPNLQAQPLQPPQPRGGGPPASAQPLPSVQHAERPMRPQPAGGGQSLAGDNAAGVPGEVGAAGGGGGAAAAAREVACGEPVDLLQRLMDSTGLKLREVKEQYWEDVPYGHLRLALAHLGRCNPGR